MPSERSDNTGEPGQTEQPRECMACRGTGSVISKLGGETSLVTCPWCEGGRVRIPGIDAQARWPRDGEQGGAGEPSEGRAPAPGENAGSR
jgi:hypothetical protein